MPFAPGSTAVDPDATAFIIYTSGTTGFPKGVMHSHIMIRNVVDRAFRMGITPADTILMYLPLYHLFGFSEGMLMSLATGARQILTETFDPSESLRLLEAERATILHGFDTHFKDLLQAYRQRPRDTASVRTGILATGMSSSMPIAREARKVFGRLLSGYGMSEVGAGVTLSALDSSEEQCVEASGYPAPGYEIRIIGPGDGTRSAGRARPARFSCAATPSCKATTASPRRPRGPIDSEGWLHSGDMGLMRADGHLRFMGRYKDMLKIGGENVDPMEVEAYLASHPAINAAAVVGAPDARLGEVAVAFVRLEPGQQVTEPEVIELLPRQDRELQDPAPRLLRRRVPNDRLRQGPEGEAARGGAPAAGVSGGRLGLKTAALAESCGLRHQQGAASGRSPSSSASASTSR